MKVNMELDPDLILLNGARTFVHLIKQVWIEKRQLDGDVFVCPPVSCIVVRNEMEHAPGNWMIINDKIHISHDSVGLVS